MQEYTYTDFMKTLDEKSAFVLNALNNYICSNYTEYKPFDIKPTNKSNKEWQLNYRKKPKVGKAIYSAYSEENKLRLRFCLLSSMTYEFLLRQKEFSDKFKSIALKQMLCSVYNSCRSYGGNVVCQHRHYYWINHRLIMTCPYPWVYIDDYDENSVADITLFIDIQMKHMTQDAKEIKGNLYAEETIQRCKEVQTVYLCKTALLVNPLLTEDHVNKPERLNRYTRQYNLVPMGAHQGLWYYHDTQVVCGATVDGYRYTEIPEGSYAIVTVNDPFSFSFLRVWNFAAKWLYENNKSICPVEASEKSILCFARFYKQGDVEYMNVYIPMYN